MSNVYREPGEIAPAPADLEPRGPRWDATPRRRTIVRRWGWLLAWFAWLPARRFARMRLREWAEYHHAVRRFHEVEMPHYRAALAAWKAGDDEIKREIAAFAAARELRSLSSIEEANAWRRRKPARPVYPAPPPAYVSE